MAERVAWVLNLDVEYELDDPEGYVRSVRIDARIDELAPRLTSPRTGLVRPGDVVIRSAGDSPAEGLAGRCWCPTPSALATLASARAVPPEAPPLAVLRLVNDRRFGVELGSGPLETRYVTELDELRAVAMRPSPSGTWVAKRAFGFAGRGQRRLAPALTEGDLAWCEKSLAGGHGIAIEPWVERDADFALHGIVAKGGALELGRPLAQRCDRFGAWIETVPVGPSSLSNVEEAALEQAALETGRALSRAGYFGPFGIDAFRYRSAAGRRVFQPRVEVNARYTMGFGLSGLSDAPDSGDGPP